MSAFKIWRTSIAGYRFANFIGIYQCAIDGYMAMIGSANRHMNCLERIPFPDLLNKKTMINNIALKLRLAAAKLE